MPIMQSVNEFAVCRPIGCGWATLNCTYGELCGPGGGLQSPGASIAVGLINLVNLNTTQPSRVIAHSHHNPETIVVAFTGSRYQRN